MKLVGTTATHCRAVALEHEPVERLKSRIVKNGTSDNHYVPKHLLGNFADAAGKLWIYDAQLSKARYGNTKSAAFECKLYPPAVENAFTKHIDTPGAEAIAGLLEQKQLDLKQWASFLRFVAAQMQRTPACFDRAATMIAPTMQKMFERIAKFHPEFRTNVRNSLKKTGATPEEVAELFRAMESGQCKVSPSKEFILEQSLKLIQLLQAELTRMRWTILGVPNGDPDLVIGDNPVMLSDEGPDDKPPAALGIRNPTIELVMPLGRRMVAIARWTGTDSFGQLVHGSAQVINERTLRYARRFVFAPHHSETLLADAVKLRGTGPKIHVSRVQVGEQLAIIPEYR